MVEALLLLFVSTEEMAKHEISEDVRKFINGMTDSFRFNFCFAFIHI